jgi:superfamily II DNA or RNA helicase
MKVRAFQRGIYIEIPADSLFTMGNKGIERLTKASTIWVSEPGETPNSPPSIREFALWSMKDKSLFVPVSCLRKITDKTLEWEIVSDKEAEQKLCMSPTKRFPITLDPHQNEILEEVRNKNRSGLIEAAMGAGKSWILLSLILGHRLLRPAAISGKGEKDTKQLLEKLRKLQEDYPEFSEQIMLSGLGRSLSKKDKQVLSEGEGIVVCTHAGLQNLPRNTKLLVLDEAHAACTPNRVSKLLELPEIKKIYGLTGTAGLRGDGGDELLESLIGQKLISKGHEHFEATGRVAPAQINAYHFTGKGIYSENPFMPDQPPQEGYSLHSTWVENHRGRHEFVADLVMSLPTNETKVIFVPHIIHAVRLIKAIEKKINQVMGDLDPQERLDLKPVIFHAKADKKDRYYMSKEEREQRVKYLEEGKIKMAIATDFLSTGFDTNMLDHIIDASGQKAIIGNIQRSGRGIRPRTKEDGSIKVNQIHTILDKTHPILHKLGEKKFSALCAYYNHREGIPNPNRSGGVKRYMDPPWVKPEERARKLNNPNNQKDPISATKNMESNDTIDHENSNYNIRPFEASNKSYEHLAPPQTTNFNPKEWRRK